MLIFYSKLPINNYLCAKFCEPKYFIRNMVNRLLTLTEQPWKFYGRGNDRFIVNKTMIFSRILESYWALWNSCFHIQSWLSFRISKGIKSEFCADINFQLVKFEIKYPLDRFLGNFCLEKPSFSGRLSSDFLSW